MPDFARIQEKLDYHFDDLELLRRALARPVGRRASGVTDADVMYSLRLSWWGDSILRCVVSEYLWSVRPPASEDELTRLRDILVDNRLLAFIAQELHVEDGMPIGESSQRNRQSRPGRKVWAGALEAVFGAVFEDRGIQTARMVILRAFEKHAKKVIELARTGRNPRSILSGL